MQQVRAKLQASMGLSLATLLLIGCGVTGSQDPALSGDSNAPVRTVEVSTPSIDFGQQPVGSQHSYQTLTVSNTGNARVTVNSISTDTNTFQWQGPALPIRLEPSQSAKVDVLFTPDAETTFNGNLSISSDASASPKRVSLLGRGKNTGAVYMAVSDHRMHAEPALPTLGSAGSQFQDPTFGAWLARVTDGNTRPDRPGKGYGTPGSSEANVWNANTTKFYVQDADGNIIAYSFNPANMQTARLGNTGNASDGLIVPLRASPSFSFADPDVLYGFSTSSPLVFSSYHFSTDSVSSLHNPTSCVAGLSGQSGDISVSGNDQRLASALGSWGTLAANTVYVYDQSGGCRWYDTVTGDIGGQWGNTGKVSTAARFRVADARISRDGEFVRIETTACTTNCEAYYVWDLSTTNLIACSAANPDYCAMPQVLGHYHMVNQGQVDDGMDVLKRPLKSPVNYAHLIQPLPSPTQRSVAMGLSWNNAMNDRLNPVVALTYRTDGAKAQREWENEVIAIRTDGVDSTVWRFCHTRTTVSNSQMAPRGNVSQDGAYFAFTSNWEGTVGSGRADVFVVELKSSGAPTDSTPPEISGVSSSGISASGATVSWTTNEASDTQVEYGTTTAYGSAWALNSAKVTSHSVVLSGLQASTLYHYRVKSRDAAGNLATSGDFTFTTAAPPPPPDTTAPVISGVSSSGMTSSGANISWATDEASDTQVEYGTTTAYASASALNSAKVTSHSVVLSGLQASTLYHYRVKPRDATGNLATSSDFTFTTTAAPQTPGASTVYGTAWGANSLRNLEVGKVAGRQLAYRFRAATSSVPESVRFYVKTGSGYSAGTGGRLRIELRSDDGTPGHMPSNTVLGTGSLSDPGAGGWNQVVMLSGAPTLQAGQLYHIVFLNTDADPVANYVSINTLDNDGGSPMQPGVTNEDLAVNRIQQAGNGWSCVCDGATPIFALSYANGAAQGQGYMDVKVSGTLPISGNNQVREIFTVSGGDRTTSRVAVRLRRTGTAGPLTVRLERNDGSVVEEGTIAASAVSTSHAWVTHNFATNHTLVSGQTYRLVLKATAGGTYEVYPLQEGSNYGFSVPSMFTDGRFQYSTDVAIWTNFQGDTVFDMQFYFAVVTP